MEFELAVGRHVPATGILQPIEVSAVGLRRRNMINRERQLEDETMETEEELNKELEDVVAKIDKAKRELKALRHPTEISKGKVRTSFMAGKERMIEAAEAAKQLNTLEQREREIRAKLQSGDH